MVEKFTRNNNNVSGILEIIFNDFMHNFYFFNINIKFCVEKHKYFCFIYFFCYNCKKFDLHLKKNKNSIRYMSFSCATVSKLLFWVVYCSLRCIVL